MSNGIPHFNGIQWEVQVSLSPEQERYVYSSKQKAAGNRDELEGACLAYTNPCGFTRKLNHNKNLVSKLEEEAWGPGLGPIRILCLRKQLRLDFRLPAVNSVPIKVFKFAFIKVT